MVRGNYTNEDAVKNVLHYVTRTRAAEDREDECLMCGGKGVVIYQPVDYMIQQIEYVQKMFGIKRRRGGGCIKRCLALMRKSLFEWDRT